MTSKPSKGPAKRESAPQREEELANEIVLQDEYDRGYQDAMNLVYDKEDAWNHGYDAGWGGWWIVAVASGIVAFAFGWVLRPLWP